jgi:hypothetical protein
LNDGIFLLYALGIAGLLWKALTADGGSKGFPLTRARRRRAKKRRFPRGPPPP